MKDDAKKCRRAWARRGRLRLASTWPRPKLRDLAALSDPFAGLPGVKMFQVELESLARRAGRRFAAGSIFNLTLGELVALDSLLPLLLAFGEAEASKSRGVAPALRLVTDPDAVVDFRIERELPGFRWDWALEFAWEAISFIEPRKDGAIDLEPWAMAVAFPTISETFASAGCLR